MAYNCADKDCERVLRFSTADENYTWLEQEFGASTNNCAAELNKNSAAVANYKESKTTVSVPAPVAPPVTAPVPAPVAPPVAPPVPAPVAPPVPAPVAPPVPAPVAPPTPPLSCDWNEVKVQIKVETSSRGTPSDISWKFYNMEYPDTILLQNEVNLNKANTYTSEKCLFSGQCFNLEIESKNAIESYSVSVDGVIEASGQGNFDTKSETISIDATVKKSTFKKSCHWLNWKPESKHHLICSRNNDEIAKLCPKTCGTC